MEDFRSRIEINPKILLGKPVFKGTRIPVYIVLDMLAEDMSPQEIVKAYPDLTQEHVHAAIRFASETAKHITEIELEAVTG